MELDDALARASALEEYLGSIERYLCQHPTGTLLNGLIQADRASTTSLESRPGS
jgi:hypothetical protein